MQPWFTPVFEVGTSVCFRWSRCFPGSSCTTPSRWAATTTVTTSTRESRSTSAPLRTIRGPSHITTAAACRSDLSRNQRLLENWRFRREKRTAKVAMTPPCTFKGCFCTFLGAQDLMTDYAKRTGNLGVCIVKKSVEFQENVLICCHEFGSVSPCTVNRKLNPGNFSLAYFSANAGIL